MKAIPNRSLYGKARRNHHRNRATRLYARQWIDEVLASDIEDPTSERYIPIRGRREFLPTVAQMTPSSMSSRDAQLELPLSSTTTGERAKRVAAMADPASSSSTTPAKDIAIRFPTRAKSPAGRAFKPPMQFNKRTQFTLSGFLLGCAMGSAAAAMLLLVVRVVVG